MEIASAVTLNLKHRIRKNERTIVYEVIKKSTEFH